MAKNITDLAPAPVFRGLLDVFPSIPTPESYFMGREGGLHELPDSILIFTRNLGEQLTSNQRKHFHHRHVFTIPLAGTGRVVLNDHAYSLSPGNCLLISPYQFHEYSEMSREIAWLFITFEHTETIQTTEPLRELNDPQILLDILAFVKTYQLPPSLHTTRQLAMRLGLILAAFEKTTAPTKSTSTQTSANEALILKVRQLVLQNLATPLSINDISAKMGISESHLRSRFRKAAEQSLGQFQRRVRLEHAARLLSHKKLSVTEAAVACGWDSPFSFSRAFQQYWGRSPKEFKG